MAHLWVETEPGEWGIRELVGQAEALDGNAGPGPGDRQHVAHHAGLRAGPDGKTWVLLAPPGNGAVRVNGMPLALGMRVLRERDEIVVNGRRRYFSGERHAVVVPFPGSDRPVTCPRCRQEVLAGTPAVACPQCDAWHHQSEELPCWTYSPTCALGDQPTELGTGYRWTPEGL